MNFGQIIDRSLKLVRNNTVLWKLGLLAVFTEGLTSGFFSLPPTPGDPATPAEEAEMLRMFENAVAWARENQALTIFLVVSLLLVIIIGWYASIRAKAGLITTIVDLENGKAPGRFRDGYRRGGPFAWRLIGLYLTFGIMLSIILALPLAVISGVAMAMGEGGQWGLYIFMIPVLFIIAAYVTFITKIAERSVVIEGERIWSSLGNAHRILFSRPGQSILAVLVDFGIQIVFFLLILAIIVIAIGLAALLALLLAAVLPNSILAAVVGAAVLLFVGGFFLLGGWFASFTISYWTLVYRTLQSKVATETN